MKALLYQMAIQFACVSSLLLFNSCSLESIEPNLEVDIEKRLIIRTDLTNVAHLVRIEVSQRDNIPLDEILTCYYYGTTTQGYYEYRFTTKNNGPGIYLLIGIIGEELEGI